MSEAITQDNLYLLLPCKIGWLAQWMVEDKGISIAEAINRIYRSNLFKKLSYESAKYWHLGPIDLYEEHKYIKSGNSSFKRTIGKSNDSIVYESLYKNY